MQISYYVIPGLILVIFLFSFFKKNDAHESFINGCKNAMNSSLKVAPYLLSMYIAISVLNASHFLSDLIRVKDFPVTLFIQGFFKPFSYNASNAFMIDNFIATGVDSKLSFTSSVLQGSKDTTIYIMTLYFSSVGIIHHKYALKVGILTDIFCFLCCLGLYYIL